MGGARRLAAGLGSLSLSLSEAEAEADAVETIVSFSGYGICDFVVL
jgi:hypothetical protein